MRNGMMHPRSVLALLLCGLIAAVCFIEETSAAAAFGLRGPAHIGRGVARPGPRRRVAREPSRWRERRGPREGHIIGRRPNRGEIRTGRSDGGINAADSAAAPAGSGGGLQLPPRGETRFVPNEVITAFAPDATAQAIDQLARRYRLTRLEAQNFPLIGTNLYRWRIASRRSVVNMIRALGGEGIVASVQPNYVYALEQGKTAPAPAGTAGDPAQYVLAQLQVPQAQKIATGEHVAIAVIDSAIDTKHPDLGGSVVRSFDALNYDERPHAHGTSIAGAIVEHGKLLGIAPGAQIFAVHAFDDTPGEARGTSFAIYKGLQWAVDNRARIVNMSFAGPADPMLRRMLTSAYDKGMVLIAAAGNGGPYAAPAYPAADPNVIAVTATDSDDHLFKMDNRGSYIAVSAPGVDILALAPGDAYQVTTGSSIAAAHVSGIAALLLERNPALKPKDIRDALIATAKPLGPTHPDAEFGAGLVNAYRAVASLDHTPAPAQDGGAVAKK
jgi:subtilisin family serine protease